ncbi:MAG: type III pantothenate kinase [Gemmatimonadota bacterium]|nr:MAG: type III pantothenate kinase [Gemmatimonadota bacterium]
MIDVGNTEITLGLFDGNQLADDWRLSSSTKRTPDEWATILTSYLSHAGHSTQEVTSSIAASVAPAVTERMAAGVGLALGHRPVQIEPSLELPVELDVDEPLQVGADRIVNTIAAVGLYQRDTVVVDFGTATTFDCITADGRFIGGVIAPGLEVAAAELSQRAAKLPATELVPPANVIGRRTEDCIRSGVLFGAAEAVDGIVRRIKSEWPGETTPYVVATGGLAEMIVPLSREIEATEPHLTLLGLKLAAEHLGLKW